MAFSTSPFDCGYSGDDVVILKFHISVNCMYSADTNHGPLSENSSSAIPNQVKLCCMSLITASAI